MERAFWLERWRTGRIGWQQAGVHPLLVRHLEALFGARAAPRVFVPLCGASPDMAWLAAQGADVVGIDLAPEAPRRFFDDADLDARVDRTCLFERWSAPRIEILVGDVFDVDAATLGPFDALYDRAALVALPVELRARYAARVAELCRPGTSALLVALEYDPSRRAGPPFPVFEPEIRALYGAAFDVTPLERVAALDDPLAQGGALALAETAWRLVRR